LCEPPNAEIDLVFFSCENHPGSNLTKENQSLYERNDYSASETQIQCHFDEYLSNFVMRVQSFVFSQLDKFYSKKNKIKYFRGLSQR